MAGKLRHSWSYSNHIKYTLISRIFMKILQNIMIIIRPPRCVHQNLCQYLRQTLPAH